MSSKKIYTTETGAKRRRRAQTTSQAKVTARRKVDTEVQSITIPELAMQVARDLAGDTGRIRVQRDGSIIVENM